MMTSAKKGKRRVWLESDQKSFSTGWLGKESSLMSGDRAESLVELGSKPHG